MPICPAWLFCDYPIPAALLTWSQPHQAWLVADFAQGYSIYIPFVTGLYIISIDYLLPITCVTILPVWPVWLFYLCSTCVANHLNETVEGNYLKLINFACLI